MKIGIGLPITASGTNGELLLSWASRVEDA